MASNSNKKEKETADQNAGIGVIGQQSSQIYSENVVFQAERGHGFAAEKANHKVDTFTGKNAKIVGGDKAYRRMSVLPPRLMQGHILRRFLMALKAILLEDCKTSIAIAHIARIAA